MNQLRPPKIIPIQPVPIDAAADKVFTLNDEPGKIYPRSVGGYFARLRWVMVWVTQLVFYGIPWIQWNDRQAVLFDLASNRFFHEYHRTWTGD